MFQIGDTVRLKIEALSNDKLIPAQFIKQGDFPNRFTVARADRLEVDGVITEAISLEECCGRIKDLDSGAPLCEYHPANLFELISRHEPLDLDSVRPERETTLHTPLGPLLQIAYVKREGASNVLVVKTPLGPLSISGPWADAGAELLKNHRIL